MPERQLPAGAARRDLAQIRLVFWVNLATAIGVGAVWTQAQLKGLNTVWDQWGAPVVILAAVFSAIQARTHPEHSHRNTLVTMAAASFFCLGAVYWSATQNTMVGWVSMSSASQFMPLLYVGAFVMLQRGAAELCWLHYAGLVLLYLVAFGWPWQQRPQDTMSIHLWTSTLTSNPAYILALQYISTLKGRISRRELEHHQSKERFLAMLSHEIRSPLQAMLGSVDLLALKARTDPERRAVDRLRESAAQLDAHLRDVTEYTRLENPAWELRDEAVDLVALGQDLCDQWRPQAQARGLDLRLDIDDPNPASAQAPDWTAVRTDGRRLRQVLGNLLNNALKYTPAGEVVLRLRAPMTGGQPLTIEVEDTGIGIPAEQLDQIFQPYVRLEDPRVAQEEGSGLGLALVRLLTDRLGLTLTVDSQPDRGSIFRLSWPHS